MSRTLSAIAVATITALTMGCGGEDPIAEIAKANAAVAEQRGVVAAAEQVVVTRQGEITEAQTRLSEARAQVKVAVSELVRLESEVDRSALDTALFREVQKRLLETSDLSQVAIVASVAEGVVTLSGNVDNSRLRDRAVQVATATEGVTRVESLIEVAVSSAPPSED